MTPGALLMWVGAHYPATTQDLSQEEKLSLLFERLEQRHGAGQ